jgi:DNA repair exonuclease SbcCD nuclease subunit
MTNQAKLEWVMKKLRSRIKTDRDRTDLINTTLRNLDRGYTKEDALRHCELTEEIDQSMPEEYALRQMAEIAARYEDTPETSTKKPESIAVTAEPPDFGDIEQHRINTHRYAVDAQRINTTLGPPLISDNRQRLARMRQRLVSNELAARKPFGDLALETHFLCWMRLIN